MTHSVLTLGRQLGLALALGLWALVGHAAEIRAATI